MKNNSLGPIKFDSPLVIAGTGHRKLGNTTITSDGPIYNKIRDHLMEKLLAFTPSMVISGMAVGFDLALADAACQLRIPFTAAEPYLGHGAGWGKADKSKHETLLGFASRIECVSEAYTNAGVYWLRDKWMVDNSNCLFAFYDGRGVGGTKLTYDYAVKSGKVVVNLWQDRVDWIL